MKELLEQLLGQFQTPGALPSWLFEKATWIVFADIVVVYYLLYRGLLLLKGTKAVRMLLGLLLLVVAYFAAKYMAFNTLTWILEQFFNSFIVVVLILFQDDIRRGLSRVGIVGPLFGGKEKLLGDELAGLNELIKSVGALSARKIGALVVWTRNADIGDYIQEGTEIDSLISEELLFSVFLPYSPIHDGAVILSKGRMTRAGCFLPLTQNPNVSKHLGTRHRAAIGLTEDTDAIVVVVSETDGKISLCLDGEIIRDLVPASLYNKMRSILESRTKRKKKGEKITGVKKLDPNKLELGKSDEVEEPTTTNIRSGKRPTLGNKRFVLKKSDSDKASESSKSSKSDKPNKSKDSDKPSKSDESDKSSQSDKPGQSDKPSKSNKSSQSDESSKSEADDKKHDPST